ncbi:MAG: asparagine synthase (glutamine-hydrolyzing), partial [Chitinophagaceae bacterium]
MCGIAGIISQDRSRVNSDNLQRMTDAIAHRGPDGEQQWINTSGTTGFGHRRLAILDLSSAALQPMHYLDRYTIVHNGEIYNYKELRDTLTKSGYRFRSKSDTEVILAAYSNYGRDCCKYFDGMFAFAIWDEQEQELFAARDRFGEKPFYYKADNSSLIFGSETKAILTLAPKQEIDPLQLLNFLTLGNSRKMVSDGRSIYQGIEELPAASTLSFNLRECKVEIRKYWELHKKIADNLNDDEVLNTFEQLYTKSIELRLRSDVSLGVSLSGGLDSSSIVAGIYEADKRPIKTYSAVFPGFSSDESAFISIINSRFGCESFTVTPGSADLVNDIKKLVWHQETFISSASVYAQYAVFKLAKETGTVVLLDGQGADEALGGYNKYIQWGLQEIYRGPAKSFREEFAKFRENNVPFDWSWKNKIAAYQPSLTALALQQRESGRVKKTNFLNRDYVTAHSPANKLPLKPGIRNLNDILHYETVESGLNELLHYADRNSMANGREVRLPFLSHELVSFIFTLPVRYKLRDGFTKWILRKAMHSRLPEQIAWRKDKIGFEPPQKIWMEMPAMQERIHESKKQL